MACDEAAASLSVAGVDPLRGGRIRDEKVILKTCRVCTNISGRKDSTGPEGALGGKGKAGRPG